MNGTIVARVRRVLHGHSDRTLIHAVSDDGLEPKLEVSSDAVRDLLPGQELTLTIAWSLQPAAPNPAPVATASTPLPSAVDEEFMALMARRRGAATTPSPASTGRGSASVTGPPSPVAEELARRLGIRPTRTTS